jgi:ABC-type dipeptide/oligopeptide/nickel transport system permease subunit
MTEPTARLEAPPLVLEGAPAAIDISAVEGLELKARSQWSYARRRFLRHRLAMVGVFGLIIIFGAGALANYIAPYARDAINLADVLKAPTSAGHHFFGTDEIGRDYLTRVIYGIRTSEQVGLTVAICSTIIGLIVGSVAGYYRGWVDNVIMRITDLVLTLPVLVTLLTVAAFLGGGGNQWVITFILVGFFWTGVCRIVRGTFLSLREKEYVEAAHALGASNSRIVFKHLIPNALGSLIVWTTLAAATAIILEASLTYLGFGVNGSGQTSLGRLVSDGAQAANTRPWLFYFPGITLLVIVLSINLIGDGIRDAFDPSNRRVRA